MALFSCPSPLDTLAGREDSNGCECPSSGYTHGSHAQAATHPDPNQADQQPATGNVRGRTESRYHGITSKGVDHMVTISAHHAKPQSYIGRHIKARSPRPGLVHRIKDWMFGEAPVGVTASGFALPTPVKSLDGTTGRVVDDVERYMKPYVTELDAIMARFRAGLAAV